MLNIKIKKLHPYASLPRKAKEDDAAYDLFSLEYLKIRPFERRTVLTGIALEIPKGYYGKIVDRSGHAAKRGIHVLAGTIDAGYRGEIGVVIINLNCLDWLSAMFKAVTGNKRDLTFDAYFDTCGTWEIKQGDAIAQICFRKHEDANFQLINELSFSSRGENGWGSSGN